jgi:hypothetical protein
VERVVVTAELDREGSTTAVCSLSHLLFSGGDETESLHQTRVVVEVELYVLDDWYCRWNVGDMYREDEMYC